MSIGKTYEVISPDDTPIELPSGRYFCYNCTKPRKLIPTPHTGTIEPCPHCGSIIVFVQE